MSEQLKFSFMERESIKDAIQDLYGWLNRIGPQLYGNDADEGRKLVDTLWREVNE